MLELLPLLGLLPLRGRGSQARREVNCKDADEGRADFLAGKKDEARYSDASNGADYRRGWQLARLGHIADQPKPAPNPQAFAREPLSDDPPWDAEPVVRRETTESQPAAAPVATSREVEKMNMGGNSPKLPNCPESQTDPKCLSRQDVRLAAGEEKPKRSKPALAGQLDLFG